MYEPVALNRTEQARNPWLTFPRPLPTPRARLFCFSHAGGSAALFHRWPTMLPPDIEVVGIQLPGHGSRFAEPPFDCLERLLACLQPEICPLLEKPFAFLGHSMGALIAYTLTVNLRASSWPLPSHLYIAGCRPPHLTSPPRPLHRLPREEFIGRLQALGGMPEDLLQDQDFLDACLPVLRADFTLYETWQYFPVEPLNLPITAFGGRQDPLVTFADLAAWQRYTEAGFQQHELPEDHFFVRETQGPFLQHLGDSLRRTFSLQA